MKRIRIIHRLRTLLACLVFLAVLAGGAGLWWANHTGLPDSWRTRIEQALAVQGLHADVGSLRYLPLRGIEASEILVYSDPSRRRTVARLHQLMFDIDRSRLARGEVRIEWLDLTGARVSLAVDPEDPESKSLEITEARGRILMSDGRKFEIKDAGGTAGGVRLEFDGDLLMYRSRFVGSPEDEALARAERRRILTRVIDLLDQWKPESAEPPLIRIDASGDLDDPKSLRALVRITGSKLRSHGLEIRRLDLRGEVRGPVTAIHHAEISTTDGRLSGRVDYDLVKRSGRFEGRSNLDLAALFRSLEIELPETMPSFGAPPEVEARGTFAREGERWAYKLTGYANLDHPEFKELSADRLESAFSFDGSRLFLDELKLLKDGRSLTGRIFVTPDLVRYEARTDLPIPFWQEAIRFQPLGKVLADFGELGDSRVSVEFKGRVDRHNPAGWDFSGTAQAANLSYRGVPARQARVTLALNHAELDFTDGEADFDYQDYKLRKSHGGPLTGKLQVDRIRYDHLGSILEIDNVRGTVWPAPVVRTFAPKIADHLESYGFHRPPTLAADGVIGLRDSLSKQDLLVTFKSGEPADYRFLDQVLTLDQPQGKVRVLPDKVQIRDLRFGLFDGIVRTSADSRYGESPQLSGEIDWTGLSLPRLGTTYEFKSPPKGRVTGRADFDIAGKQIGGFNADGHIALEEGELFDVPMFGPLSPAVAAVLGRKKAAFQEANDAFCTFDVKKGVLRTSDFLTTTSSMVFTGEAEADLGRRTLDMTVRMNARGLLGVITLPLRPFYGLFQFRGTGPLSDPEWKNVRFTSPPADQEKILLDPPKARAVLTPASG